MGEGASRYQFGVLERANAKNAHVCGPDVESLKSEGERDYRSAKPAVTRRCRPSSLALLTITYSSVATEDYRGL